MIKGKEASKYDFMNVLPDFKEAIEQATKVLNELQKLNLNTNYNCKDSRKKEYRKKEKKFAGKDRTLSFSFRLGSHIYKLSLYWPKLVRLFIGDDDWACLATPKQCDLILQQLLTSECSFISKFSVLRPTKSTFHFLNELVMA